MAIAVIDVGKTNAKVALVDRTRLVETAVRKTPNAVLRDGLYPHYDVDALWSFMQQSLGELAKLEPIEAISITTHGATAALVDDTGALAMPILDYEHTGPDTLTAEYNRERPPFSESGTPRLPIGLNLGAQLFWQQEMFPADWAKVRTILMYPQYWAMRLTGRMASEGTSLGCHTDLWAPHRQDFSRMTRQLGWRSLFPPLMRATDELGPITAEIASRTGLAASTPVMVGIHDSNASLLPHLLSRTPPFTVLSTGTWVIALAIGAGAKPLDPARDTLINVDAFGSPVPSARFMGGRENETLGKGLPATTPQAVEQVLASGLMYLPSAAPGSGPFPQAQGHWVGEGNDAERRGALSFYLALMASICLDLIGAQGPTIIEGPFASNPEFAAMLRATTGRDVIVQAEGTGTSVGAAMLVTRAAVAQPGQSVAEPPPTFNQYADKWRAAAG